MDYKNKIQDLLDTSIYRKLSKDPTGSVVRTTEQRVKQSSLTRELKIAVRCPEALPPWLYGLPKIHMEGVPPRPIVSAIGSPTYALKKHLASLLQPPIAFTEAHVGDSTHFIEKIKNSTLGPDDVLVSFDVVSLFTKVPLRETLEFIGGLFTPEITALFRHVLTTTYFQFDGEFYEQLDGVAMGSLLSPVVANFYMERFEDLGLSSATFKGSVGSATWTIRL